MVLSSFNLSSRNSEGHSLTSTGQSRMLLAVKTKRSFVERYSFIDAFNDNVGSDTVKPFWYRIDAHENSHLGSAIIVAASVERTLGAVWLRAFAEFLTMLSEQLVCPDERIVVLW